MKTLLERVEPLDHLIRQLRKLSSRIRSGEMVDGYRECNRIVSELERDRNALIEETGDENAD